LKWHNYRTNEWDLDFRAFLKSLELKGKPVICAGDLNVAHQDLDIHDPKRAE
jgi:exodeoxyribonuclease-3